jgi:GR25 family glycosyltransferase involved in LPS biosynthesis
MDTIYLDNIDFYCISLLKRKDRRNWIDSHLKKYNLSFKYFDALTSYDNESGIRFSNDTKSGSIGCGLSHYNLIKNYNGDKILGIFEDDVFLSDDFIDRFDYLEKNMNLDWDIFFLSSFYHLNDDNRRWHKTGDYELTNIKYINRVYGTFCTHAYLVNPKSISKLIKLMEENSHKSYAVDHLYILIQPQLNCYSFTPGMANQIVSKSDVDGVLKDQNVFESIVGPHFFSNDYKSFDYDTYFKIESNV